MTGAFNYPPAKRDTTIVDDYFGVKVNDPYRWLEDPDSSDTKTFVDSQNVVTKKFLTCEYLHNINR